MPSRLLASTSNPRSNCSNATFSAEDRRVVTSAIKITKITKGTAMYPRLFRSIANIKNSHSNYRSSIAHLLNSAENNAPTLMGLSELTLLRAIFYFVECTNCALQSIYRTFLTTTIDDRPIHKVLNATMVGSNFRSDTQINNAEVTSVIMCSCQISFCQISPGRITAAFATQASASTML